MMKSERLIYLLSPQPKEGTVHLPMIEFRLMPENIDLSHCDILMFTSKQAVRSVDTLTQEWKKYPCLAIGQATAQEIKALGGKVLYQPETFYAQTLGQDIIRRFKDKNILYLRPKEVSFDSKSFLAKAGIALQEQIIYETFCVTYENNEKPSKGAIIIFTSPSTIHCFLKNFEWDETYTAVIIGEATKEHLPSDVRYVVADKPLISECIIKANELLLTSNSK